MVGGNLFESFYEEKIDLQSLLLTPSARRPFPPTFAGISGETIRDSLATLSTEKGRMRTELKTGGLKDILHLNSEISNSLPVLSSVIPAALPFHIPLGILKDSSQKKWNHPGEETYRY